MSEDSKNKYVCLATSESTEAKKNNDSCILSSVSQGNTNPPCLLSVPPVGEPSVHRKKKKSNKKTLNEVVELLHKKLDDNQPKDLNDEFRFPTIEKVSVDCPNDETEPNRHGHSSHGMAKPTKPSPGKLSVAQIGESSSSAIRDQPQFQLQDYAEAMYGKEVFSKGEPPVVGANTALMVYVQNPHYRHTCTMLMNENAAPLPPPSAANGTTTDTATHDDAGPMDAGEPEPNAKKQRRSNRKTHRPTKLDEYV